MVSEFMLQQTPVNRVLEPWREWLQRWPTPGRPGGRAGRRGRPGLGRVGLSAAGAAAACRGEGDRRRARGPGSRRTRRAAGAAGVGDYTAAAVASFAFGARHVVLDVNVRRVLARLEGGTDAPTGAPTVAETHRAEAWLPQGPDAARMVGGGHGTRGAGVPGDPRLRLLPGSRPLPLACRGTSAGCAAAPAALCGHRSSRSWARAPSAADAAEWRRAGRGGVGRGVAGRGAGQDRAGNPAGRWPDRQAGSGLRALSPASDPDPPPRILGGQEGRMSNEQHSPWASGEGFGTPAPKPQQQPPPEAPPTLNIACIQLREPALGRHAGR